MPRSKYATPKQEYVQAPIKISVCRLAIKWKIPPRGLRKRCHREKWVAERADFQKRLSQKVEEKAIAEGGEVQAEETRQEMADLKAVRKQILKRLLPSEIYGVYVGKPKDYAVLTGALIAVDKQMCLRRGVSGGVDALGAVTVVIKGLDAGKSEEEER